MESFLFTVISVGVVLAIVVFLRNYNQPKTTTFTVHSPCCQQKYRFNLKQIDKKKKLSYLCHKCSQQLLVIVENNQLRVVPVVSNFVPDVPCVLPQRGKPVGVFPINSGPQATIKKL